MSYPRRDVVKTCESLAVTAASSVVVADNPSRLSLLVQNQSGGNVYLRLRTAVGVNPTATADDESLLLANGEEFSTTDYTGPVAMIAPGSVEVFVLEI